LEFLQMTRRRTYAPLIGEIIPGQFYRTTQSPAIFDLGWQATKNKIRSGEFPRPMPLSEGSLITGWLGSQILEHRARMQALAEGKAKVDALRPKQPQPAALVKKVKKTKLRRPARRAKLGA
jgi:hypothetical protein